MEKGCDAPRSRRPGRIVGLIPDAGQGSRFSALGYPKEFLPVLKTLPLDRTRIPLLCEEALGQILRAGAGRCVWVVSPQKLAFAQFFERLAGRDLPLAFTLQSQPEGLPNVVRGCRPWLNDADVLLALPDTIVRPMDAGRILCETHRRTRADVTLAVFPTDEPERLGPVDFDASGTVHRILDKPARTRWRNTWGMAAWSPRFTEFCAEWDARAAARKTEERVLGSVFEKARANGFKIVAQFFPTGSFHDLGTPDALRSALGGG